MNLSDPSIVTEMPFPFLGNPVPATFNLDEKRKFCFRGREEFSDLADHVEYLLNENTCGNVLIVDGFSGSGVSYILAGLVAWLMHVGERVVYIPNVQDLTFDYLFDALLPAAVGQPDTLKEMEVLKEMETEAARSDRDIWKLIGIVRHTHFALVVDGDEGTTDEGTNEISKVLNTLASHRLFIKGGSRLSKPSSTFFCSGLSAKEFCNWGFAHRLNHDQQQSLLSQSGGNVAWMTELKGILDQTPQAMTLYVVDLFLALQAEKIRCELMPHRKILAGLLGLGGGDPSSSFQNTHFQNKHFQNNQVSCGLALEVAASLIRNNQVFDGDLTRRENNAALFFPVKICPSSMWASFWTYQGCASFITLHGLRLRSSNVSRFFRPSVEYRLTKPNVYQFEALRNLKQTWCGHFLSNHCSSGLVVRYSAFQKAYKPSWEILVWRQTSRHCSDAFSFFKGEHFAWQAALKTTDIQWHFVWILPRVEAAQRSRTHGLPIQIGKTSVIQWFLDTESVAH